MIIAGVFNPDDAKRFGDTLLDVEKLVADIAAGGKIASTFSDADVIVAHLAREMTEGDVVAVMSNGGFGGIHDKLLAALQTQPSSTASS